MTTILHGQIPREERGDLVVVVVEHGFGYNAVICDGGTSSEQFIELTHERNPSPARVYYGLSPDAAERLAEAVKRVRKDDDLPSLDAVVMDPMLVRGA